jgi:hypothetical protein
VTIEWSMFFLCSRYWVRLFTRRTTDQVSIQAVYGVLRRDGVSDEATTVTTVSAFTTLSKIHLANDPYTGLATMTL